MARIHEEGKMGKSSEINSLKKQFFDNLSDIWDEFTKASEHFHSIYGGRRTKVELDDLINMLTKQSFTDACAEGVGELAADAIMLREKLEKMGYQLELEATCEGFYPDWCKN